MKIIFATEDLISDGVISIEKGDEIIKEAIVVIISEQLLHKLRKEKLEEHNRYVCKENRVQK